MFREWGFLISEITVLLLLAALLGLLVGWIIWGRRRGLSAEEGAELKGELEYCRKLHGEKDARIRDLEAKAERLEAGLGTAVAAVLPQAVSGQPEPATTGARDFDGDGVIEGKAEGSKPLTLSAARGGVPDDLKQIKGIGPKLEALCHRLGFYHFDQIAAWSAEEVAWVDANLEGFHGRVSRDAWVRQAQGLAAGGEAVFSGGVKT